MYKGLTNSIPFFVNRDKVFIAELVPLLIPLKVNSNEFIYKKGESPNFGKKA